MLRGNVQLKRNGSTSVLKSYEKLVRQQIGIFFYNTPVQAYRYNLELKCHFSKSFPNSGFTGTHLNLVACRNFQPGFQIGCWGGAGLRQLSSAASSSIWSKFSWAPGQAGTPWALGRQVQCFHCSSPESHSNLRLLALSQLLQEDGKILYLKIVRYGTGLVQISSMTK